MPILFDEEGSSGAYGDALNGMTGNQASKVTIGKEANRDLTQQSHVPVAMATTATMLPSQLSGHLICVTCIALSLKPATITRAQREREMADLVVGAAGHHGVDHLTRVVDAGHGQLPQGARKLNWNTHRHTHSQCVHLAGR